jgi:hypothetical protein
MSNRIAGLSRLFGLGLIAGCLLAIPWSHATAQKKGGPPAKVSICHFPGGSAVGHVIEVSENAVEAHVSKHGDCTQYLARENGACRCLTCDELCLAAARRCAAECAPGDSACVAACRATFNECTADCEEPAEE